MCRVPFCVAFVAALAGDLWAQESPPPPKAPPLSWGSARIEGENLACVVRTFSYTLKRVSKTSVKDGQRVTNPRPVGYSVYSVDRMEWRTVPRKDVRAYVTGTKGPDPTKSLQPLDVAKLPQTLKGNPRVLFAVDDRGVASSDIKGEPEGTLVLILPPAMPEKK